jgi:mono/diheme cytochrome c family protein
MRDPSHRIACAVAGVTAVAAAAAFLVHGEVPAQEASRAPEPVLTREDWTLSASETRGRVVYTKYCVGCHGEEGRGDGPASAFLDPLPRNFQSGKFKFRSTPSGELPLEADLVRTVTCGLPGSSMPGFPLVPEIERKDVVRYVLALARLGIANRTAASLVADEGLTREQVRKERAAGLKAEAERTAAAVRRISVPPEVENSPGSVARGHALFDKQCAACHGARGVGDGASSYTLRDWQNAAIRPRDFTTGVFRAGSTPEDVFIRIKTGLSGTPMPGYPNLKDDEIWDMAHFILSLKDPARAKPRMAPGCGHEEGDAR